MASFFYNLADWFMMIFHGLLTLFNFLGWIVPRWRKTNLILLLLTGFSWFIVGIFKGFGYCPFTDLHWSILEAAGRLPEETSYISYFITRLTGFSFSPTLIDGITLAGFSAALGISLVMNWLDHKRRVNQF